MVVVRFLIQGAGLIKKSVSIALMVGVSVLVGCGPHPGAGTWLPLAESESEYTRLEVNFDGKAEFFLTGKEAAELRCFWGGDSARSISMKCSAASNPDVDIHYVLKITDSDRAELLQAGQSVMLMKRQD